MTSRASSPYGLLARFDTPAALLAAATEIRKAGYTRFDCYSPFPIHGMDQAMGLKRSSLGWVIGLFGFGGVACGVALQWWTNAVDYPLVIDGKPYFSFQAYVPVAFALGVLLAAFSAAIGMLVFNRLPRPFHPLFSSSHFRRVSNDGFFISIEAADPQFDGDKTAALLRSLGGVDVEVIET
jgi:hypothetical protein